MLQNIYINTLQDPTSLLLHPVSSGCSSMILGPVLVGSTSGRVQSTHEVALNPSSQRTIQQLGIELQPCPLLPISYTRGYKGCVAYGLAIPDLSCWGIPSPAQGAVDNFCSLYTTVANSMLKQDQILHSMKTMEKLPLTSVMQKQAYRQVCDQLG